MKEYRNEESLITKTPADLWKRYAEALAPRRIRDPSVTNIYYRNRIKGRERIN